VPSSSIEEVQADWVTQARHGALQRYEEKADSGLPNASEPAAMNLSAEGTMPTLVVNSESEADGAHAGPLKETSSRIDTMMSDRAAHGSQVEVSQALTAATMTLQRTSSEVHPLIMSPPAANALKQTIQFMMNDQMPEAEIQLDPPELGSLMVKLKVENGQHTHVVFQSPHPSVRDLLADHVDRLRESLAEMGLDLGGVEVEVGSQGRDSSGHLLDQFADSLAESQEDANQVVSNSSVSERGVASDQETVTTSHLINERV
jgi:flagellar hook-length control protein FliK